MTCSEKKRVEKALEERVSKHKPNRILNAAIIFFAVVLALLLYLNFSMFSKSSPLVGEVYVHFIDVGQADCILIQSEAGNVVIDGGENATKTIVTEYIKNAGVETIDYIIATHPHSDHIGGLDDIIATFDIKALIMPDAINTTTSFERLLDAISSKELTAIIPTVGDKFYVGNMEFIIVAPGFAVYDELNNYSVGVKMSYGSTSFLFTGDAEALSENEILAGGINIKADVFKAGHHGSRTSNTSLFLDAVNPNICVITCGTDNEYNHPHPEVLNELSKRGIETLRTDELGTIIIKSDGKILSVN